MLTKRYADMCREATQIQNLKRDQYSYVKIMNRGDWYYMDGEFRLETNDNSLRPMEAVWLPLQHQLQEIADTPILLMISRFNQFCNQLYESNESTWDWKMEELQIQFLMKRKYEKVWIDNTWKMIPKLNRARSSNE